MTTREGIHCKMVGGGRRRGGRKERRKKNNVKNEGWKIITNVSHEGYM